MIFTVASIGLEIRKETQKQRNKSKPCSGVGSEPGTSFTAVQGFTFSTKPAYKDECSNAICIHQC